MSAHARSKTATEAPLWSANLPDHLAGRQPCDECTKLRRELNVALSQREYLGNLLAMVHCCVVDMQVRCLSWCAGDTAGKSAAVKHGTATVNVAFGT